MKRKAASTPFSAPMFETILCRLNTDTVLITPCVLAQAAVLQERPQLEEGAHIVLVSKTMPRPDDRDILGGGGVEQFYHWLDHAPQLDDIDVAFAIPAVGIEKVILRVDHHNRRPARHQVPMGVSNGSIRSMFRYSAACDRAPLQAVPHRRTWRPYHTDSILPRRRCGRRCIRAR